jgi:hypothetical protein
LAEESKAETEGASAWDGLAGGDAALFNGDAVSTEEQVSCAGVEFNQAVNGQVFLNLNTERTLLEVLTTYSSTFLTILKM